MRMSATRIGAGSAAPASYPVEYQRIYVWELPVRLYHWINALAIVALCVTGYLIGAPTRAFYASESYQQYWFGWVRFIHFTAGFVYVFVTLGRLYWAFFGNKYSRWNVYIPIKRWQQKEIVDVMTGDVLQVKHGPMTIGHNAMAGFSYFVTFLAFLFQTITGFALYAGMSNSWFPRLFVWIVPLMGGDASVRFWHHLFLWFFVAFAVIHIYLSIYHDYIEGRGTISAIVGGWKFGQTREKYDH